MTTTPWCTPPHPPGHTDLCLHPLHPGPCAGPKKAVRRATRPRRGRAAHAPQTTAGSPHDITDQLDYTQLAQLPEYGHAGNQRLHHIATLQKFDGPPRLATPEQITQAIADGGREIWRGHRPGKDATPGSTYADQLRDGPARYSGGGIYGNGIYFSSDRGIATTYTDLASDSVTRGVLPATAKTITYTDLLRRMAADETVHQADHQTKAARLLDDLAKARDTSSYRQAWEIFQGRQDLLTDRDTILTDPGSYAAAHGYDAVVVPIVDPYNDTPLLEEIVVLNRGALLLEEPRTRTAALHTSTEVLNTVRACLPPHVPTPKPGPCPEADDEDGRRMVSPRRLLPGRWKAAATGKAAMRAARAAAQLSQGKPALVAAARGYQANSRNLNARLRRMGAQVADPAQRRIVNEMNADAIDGFDTMMGQSRLDADVAVWRGIADPAGLFGAAWHSGADNTGLEWIDHGYVSTSADRDVAARFTQTRAGGQPVLMRLLVPKGVRALDMGQRVDADGPDVFRPTFTEDELLVDRGYRFRVVADHGVRDGARQLDVEVLPAAAAESVRRVAAAAGDEPEAGDGAGDRFVDVGPAVQVISGPVRTRQNRREMVAMTGFAGGCLHPGPCARDALMASGRVEGCRVGIVKPGPCPGPKKSVSPKSAVRKLLKTPPKGGKSGTKPGSARVSGADLTGELDYRALAAKTPGRGRPGPGDRALGEIAARQGFDGKPQVVSSRELDEVVRDGGVEMFRGVHAADGRSAGEWAQELRSGAAYYGHGLSANGIHAGDRAQASRYTMGDPDGLVRMALRPDAKVIDFSEAMEQHRPNTGTAGAQRLEREQRELMRQFREAQAAGDIDGAVAAWERYSTAKDSAAAKKDSVLSDMGRWAAAKGYDAIRVPSLTSGGPDEHVVLNRTALVVEEPKRRGG